MTPPAAYAQARPTTKPLNSPSSEHSQDAQSDQLDTVSDLPETASARAAEAAATGRTREEIDMENWIKLQQYGKGPIAEQARQLVVARFNKGMEAGKEQQQQDQQQQDKQQLEQQD